MEKHILTKQQKETILTWYENEEMHKYLISNIDIEWSVIKTSDKDFPYYLNIGLKNFDCLTQIGFNEIMGVLK